MENADQEAFVDPEDFVDWEDPGDFEDPEEVGGQEVLEDSRGQGVQEEPEGQGDYADHVDLEDPEDPGDRKDLVVSCRPYYQFSFSKILTWCVDFLPDLSCLLSFGESKNLTYFVEAQIFVN